MSVLALGCEVHIKSLNFRLLDYDGSIKNIILLRGFNIGIIIVLIQLKVV